MIKFKKSDLYMTAIIFCCFTLILFMMNYPRQLSDGVKSGIELCACTLIPSMFPFFVVSSFLLKSGAISFLGKIIDKVSLKLFKLSGCAFAVFIISLLSGFPVGAKLTAKLKDSGSLSQSDCARLMTCTVNAGPAFVVVAVGANMYLSKTVGLIIFASLTFSAVIIMIVSSFFYKHSLPERKFDTCFKISFPQCLVESVSDATDNMINVCGFVLVFSCFMTKLSSLSDVSMLFEVSFGAAEAVKSFSPPVTAAVIGWGGLCVHCQIFSCITKCRGGIFPFFSFRVLHGLLAGVSCRLLLKFFPVATTTFAGNSQKFDFDLSSNLPSCIGLMLMCAILIVDFEEGRKNKGQTLYKFKSLKKSENFRKS